MINLELTSDEMFLVRNALHSFLSDFSHDEADLITRIQLLLQKVDAAHEQGSGTEEPAGAVR